MKSYKLTIPLPTLTTWEREREANQLLCAIIFFYNNNPWHFYQPTSIRWWRWWGGMNYEIWDKYITRMMGNYFYFDWNYQVISMSIIIQPIEISSLATHIKWLQVFSFFSIIAILLLNAVTFQCNCTTGVFIHFAHLTTHTSNNYNINIIIMNVVDGVVFIPEIVSH